MSYQAWLKDRAAGAGRSIAGNGRNRCRIRTVTMTCPAVFLYVKGCRETRRPSDLYSGRCAVCDRTVYGIMQGKIPLVVYFHIEGYAAEKLDEGLRG